MIRLKTLRKELPPTVRLALPLVLAELGWMSMAIVDTIMVGHLPDSATAMGAVSLGSNIFIVPALFGAGLLMGLDTLVSQAFGAGQREDCHRSLINSIYLSVALTPILAAPVWLLPNLLRSMHIDPSILALAVPYTNALVVGLFPLLLYFAVRRCLQAMNMVRIVAFALITANIVNAVGNWVLIYGKWGAPALGAVGSGWSTAIARLYMAAVLIVYLLWYDARHRTELLKTPVDIDLPRIRRLLTLGYPAALQFTLESGIFALVTALIARLGPVPLASHQIALNTVAFTYMVPLGISSAAAVRVGQAIGRKDPRAAGDAGNHCTHVHARDRCHPRHHVPARRRSRLPAFRRHSNRGDRCPPRSRRNPHTHALPFNRLLDRRPPTRLLALLRPQLGRLRPLGRPKSRANPDRRSSSRSLAPHDPPPCRSRSSRYARLRR